MPAEKPSAPIEEDDGIDVNFYDDIPLEKFFNSKQLEKYYSIKF